MLEYETVNLEKDAIQVVGRQYDLATGTEKLMTQDGRTLDIPEGLQGKASQRTTSQSSGHIEGDLRPAGVERDLEAQVV